MKQKWKNIISIGKGEAKVLLLKEREEIVNYGRKLISNGLTKGTGGNISIYNRKDNLVAISPSGLDYFESTVDDVVVVNIKGDIVESSQGLKPSSEINLHLILYKNREEANAIVHTHSKFATSLACMGWNIEPVHYLIGLAGYDVRCAKYAIYGSDELAKNALEAINDRNAVLLANHGLVTLGTDIDRAFSTAEHLEFVSEIYYLTKTLGEPKILTKPQIDEVMKKFNTYRYK